VFGETAPIWNEGKNVYSQSELDVFRAAAERVRLDLQELGKDSDVFGVIHRDLHTNNLLFHNGKAYIIDFENCGWGYYLFDLAVTHWTLEGFGERGVPKQVALLEGYQRDRPLPEAHWRYLRTFVAMRMVQRTNVVLTWETPTHRPWGPGWLPGSVKALEEFLASEGEAVPVALSSPWWRKAFL
jgi:Ser/Thr protein kinase RdoA (MazF antagonist)